MAITNFENKPNGSSTNGAAKPEEKKPADAKPAETKPSTPAVVQQQPKPQQPPPPPTDAALARAMELLKNGGFTRRLTWRDRRNLRKLERKIDAVREQLHQAFPDTNSSVAKSLDSLAHIEVTARLEMMRATSVKK